MSRYLAPIHSWLFNKIKLHEALEEKTIAAFRNEFGDDVNTIIDSAYVKYGTLLEDKTLEELIDSSNIHGWLQNRIEITETRQSFILAHFITKYGDKAKKIARDVYSKQGIQSGEDASKNFDVTYAPQIYQALNNYILDGMPCDNVNNVTYKSNEKLIWKNSQCLHRGYWVNTGADLEFLYELRYIWTKKFIESANNLYTFEENKETTNETEVFVHEIVKK